MNQKTTQMTELKIFIKNNKFGYTPTYNYYKNGNLVKNS